jgi:ATP-dependent Clp protease ATP-binding subunit ClpA
MHQMSAYLAELVKELRQSRIKEIRPEDLLLKILTNMRIHSSDPGIIIVGLRHLNVKIEEMAEKLSNDMTDPGIAMDDDGPHYSDSFKGLLGYAAQESVAVRSYDVGPEHIVLALLRHDFGVATEVLKSRGITAEMLEEQLKLLVNPVMHDE